VEPALVSAMSCGATILQRKQTNLDPPMGNAAAKQRQENATLGDGKLQKGQAIATSLVSTSTVQATGKGSTWMQGESALFSFEHKGLIRSHTLVKDASGTVVATLIIHKKGFNSCTNYICKAEPAYAGQPALTVEQLHKVNLPEDTKIYPFGIIETQNGLASAKSTYSLVTGQDTVKELYTAEKLSALFFFALFQQGETTIAKAHLKVMTPVLDASAGVDLLAVVCMGNTLVGDGSSAGALAGAGVV